MLAASSRSPSLDMWRSYSGGGAPSIHDRVRPGDGGAPRTAPALTVVPSASPSPLSAPVDVGRLAQWCRDVMRPGPPLEAGERGVHEGAVLEVLPVDRTQRHHRARRRPSVARELCATPNADDRRAHSPIRLLWGPRRRPMHPLWSQLSYCFTWR